MKMKITNIFVVNAHIVLFFGTGAVNSCGFEPGAEICVGKTKKFLNFSYRQNAYSNAKPGHGVSGDGLALIGAEIDAIGVSSENEKLAILFSTGERRSYEVIFSKGPLVGGQSDIFYSLTEVENEAEFFLIFSGGEYIPRRVRVPAAFSSFIFKRLVNEEDFKLSDQFEKLYEPDGVFYSSNSGYSTQNQLRPSLHRHPGEAFNQIFALLFALYGENGRWKELLMVEAPKNAKEWAPFEMLIQALKEVLGELVDNGLAKEKEPLLQMKRWLVIPPHDETGESQAHDVLVGNLVVARSGV